MSESVRLLPAPNWTLRVRVQRSPPLQETIRPPREPRLAYLAGVPVQMGLACSETWPLPPEARACLVMPIAQPESASSESTPAPLGTVWAHSTTRPDTE